MRCGEFSIWRTNQCRSLCPAYHKANQTEAAYLGVRPAALAEGDWPAALAAGRSWRLRHTEATARMAFLAAAAAGDTARALRWRDRATDVAGA